ncbi:methyltransferase [Glutamicibacter sp. MNS18]|uniref:class I SAM-dependent methyltransferase n=1 Tax=Glutamicibacter sp. MNS18 TaxID=2989817 RepID=UPI0022359616|nr:methyltransferase [Glutamicibacter sp. MNS18]MCW4464547.1 methyltransferase [Glutamicibacter sp. MNS18]
MNELLSALSRYPDVQAPNLHAVDAADRLVLDTVQSWPAEVSVLGDNYGALTLGALSQGAARVRVHTDSLTAQRAITANLERLAPQWLSRVQLLPAAEALAGATLVLMVLPRGLDVLDEYAAAIATHADEHVLVHAGGRIKHMNLGMNQVLSAHFGELDVSLARQKSRVLTVREPREVRPAAKYPVRATHTVAGHTLSLVAGAGTFGQARLDPGTRLLLENLPDLSGHRELVDLACGNGSIGVYAALLNPELRVQASDHSASAVQSTLAAAEANGLSARITAVQDDGLSRLPAASSRLVTLNPPFHMGNTVHAGIALKLIDEAARVLADGGRFICVFNSHLRYRSEISRRIGPTSQLARDAKFTVLAATRER